MDENHVWLSIYSYGGVITETRVFGNKTDAMIYFDSIAKDYDIEKDLEDYNRDEKTGYCNLYYPDGGRHPVEMRVERKPIETTLVTTKMEGEIE